MKAMKGISITLETIYTFGINFFVLITVDIIFNINYNQSVRLPIEEIEVYSVVKNNSFT